MTLVNGQLANQSTFNNAFVSRTSDTSAEGKISLENVDSNIIADIQGYTNEIASVVGVTGEGDANKNNYATNNYVTDGQSRKAAIEALDANLKTKNDFTDIYISDLFDEVGLINDKFNGVTGHTHDGTSGNGPKISAANIENVKLKGYFVKGTDISSIIAMGSSKDISALMSGKTASSGSTVKGVVVDAPYNKIFIQNGFGDKVVDASGNEVYGRLTYSSPTWTLSFYVNIAGTETAFSFTTSANISWYYQELFNPIADDMVYSEFANIPSENATEDVLPSSETVAGKVFLANTAPPTIASTAAKGTSTRAAKEDHTHDGVTSVNGSKGAVTVNAATVGLTNVTDDAQLKRSGNDYTAITEKTTVVDDDLVLIEDSEDSFNKKKVKMLNMGGGSGSGSGVSAWATATAYVVDQVISYNQQLFICISAHTSGTFASDYLSGGRWVLSSKNGNYFVTGSTFESGNPDFWTLSTISGYSAGTWPTATPTASGTPTVTSTSPISGTKSLQLTTATQFTLGSGLQYQIISVDNAIKGKVVNLSFDYQINAGASNLNLSGTSANTFYVGIYDTTNAAWIQTSNTYGINSIGTALYNSTFQMPYNTSSIIAVIFCANLNTSGTTTIVFDNFELSRKISPSTNLRNPVGTIIEHTSLTPPTGYLYCDGTAISRTTYAALFGVVGTTYGTGDGSTTFNLPDLRGIFVRGTGSQTIGSVTYSGTLGTKQNDQMQGHKHAFHDSSVNSSGTYPGNIGGNSTGANNHSNAVQSPTSDGVNGTPRTGAETMPANMALARHICYDNGNVQLSSDAGNSQFYSKVGLSTANLAVTANTTINWPTVFSDKSGMYSAGTWTIKSPGKYSIKIAELPYNATSNYYFIFKNGTKIGTIGYVNASSLFVSGGSYEDEFVAGDLITIRPSGNDTIIYLSGFYRTYVTLEKTANPQTIAASDTVSARYTQSSGQSISDSTYTTVIFGTKAWDSHGAYNPATGVFTAPMSGEYEVGSQTMFASAAWPSLRYAVLVVRKNGVNYASSPDNVTQVALTMPYATYPVRAKVKLLAGETASIVIQHNRGAATSLATYDLHNWIEINRVGNY